MTYLARIASVIRDLRELQVIRETDKIQYNCVDDLHHITIISKKTDDINKAFLKEFSSQEIFDSSYNETEVVFLIRDPEENWVI